MYMDDLLNSNKNKVIGVTLVNKNGGVLLADESIYSFMGTDTIPNIFKYVKPDRLEEFKEYFNNCTEKTDAFSTYLKRYDGEYVLVSIRICLTVSQDKELIKLSIYDSLYLAERYDIINDYAHKFSNYMKMSGKYFFEYELSTKKICVYKGRDTLYNMDLDTLTNETINKGGFTEDSMNSLYHICNDMKTGASSFFYQIKTCKALGDIPSNSTLAINGSAVEIDGKTKFVICTMSIAKSDEGFYDMIKERTNLDALTGLMNKPAIKSYVINKMVSEPNKRLTIAIVDLDNFKMVNDTYGHMFGDDTLVTVATVLKSIVGNRGAVGRIGGDEFFVVLEDFDDGNAAIRPILKSIRNHVEWSFKNILSDIKVTCSIGIATYPDDADNYENLFKLADRCLYIAKSKGRDRFIIYTPKLHGSLADIISVSNTINMNEYVSETEKNNHLISVIDRLNSVANYVDGKNVIKKVMLEMLYYYSVDRVGFYPFSSKDGIIHVCNYDIQNEDKPIELYNTYTEEFINDLATIGNYQNIESEFPELYAHLNETGIYSIALQKIYENDEDKLKGLFIISTYNRYQKWSSIDIKLITVLFKLMSKYV